MVPVSTLFLAVLIVAPTVLYGEITAPILCNGEKLQIADVPTESRPYIVSFASEADMAGILQYLTSGLSAEPADSDLPSTSQSSRTNRRIGQTAVAWRFTRDQLERFLSLFSQVTRGLTVECDGVASTAVGPIRKDITAVSAALTTTPTAAACSKCGSSCLTVSGASGICQDDLSCAVNVLPPKCLVCEDTKASCQIWKLLGECNGKASLFMDQHCPKSCGKCGTTASPSTEPSVATVAPTAMPTVAPTIEPTVEPSSAPSEETPPAPTDDPSPSPSIAPSASPSSGAVFDYSVVSLSPTLATPQPEPELNGTSAPVGAVFEYAVTASDSPAGLAQSTAAPSASPSAAPSTTAPTSRPSLAPSTPPLTPPSAMPTALPTRDPTSPTLTPTDRRTAEPSDAPTAAPTPLPTQAPSTSAPAAASALVEIEGTDLSAEPSSDAPDQPSVPSQAPIGAETGSPTRSNVQSSSVRLGGSVVLVFCTAAIAIVQ